LYNNVVGNWGNFCGVLEPIPGNPTELIHGNVRTMGEERCPLAPIIFKTARFGRPPADDILLVMRDLPVNVSVVSTPSGIWEFKAHKFKIRDEKVLAQMKLDLEHILSRVESNDVLIEKITKQFSQVDLSVTFVRWADVNSYVIIL
jgi:hypothetical protein